MSNSATGLDGAWKAAVQSPQERTAVLAAVKRHEIAERLFSTTEALNFDDPSNFPVAYALMSKALQLHYEVRLTRRFLDLVLRGKFPRWTANEQAPKGRPDEFLRAVLPNHPELADLINEALQA